MLELATAFRQASGFTGEAVVLPRLPEELRVQTLANAPQPLAQAVAALEAARNAHQARDALRQVVRVAVRLLGVIALAAHAHVGAGTRATESLRGLRRRALADDEWLELARELCRPFARMRDAHPVPELVAFLLDDASAVTELLRLRGAAEESSD